MFWFSQLMDDFVHEQLFNFWPMFSPAESDRWLAFAGALHPFLLYCVLCCVVLQCIVLAFIVLFGIAFLNCVVRDCSVPCCIASVLCNVVYCLVLYCTVVHSFVLFCPALCCILPPSTVLSRLLLYCLYYTGKYCFFMELHVSCGILLRYMSNPDFNEVTDVLVGFEMIKTIVRLADPVLAPTEIIRGWWVAVCSIYTDFHRTGREDPATSESDV